MKSFDSSQESPWFEGGGWDGGRLWAWGHRNIPGHVAISKRAEPSLRWEDHNSSLHTGLLTWFWSMYAAPLGSWQPGYHVPCYHPSSVHTRFPHAVVLFPFAFPGKMSPIHPGWVAQLVRASSHLDTPRLWVQSPVRARVKNQPMNALICGTTDRCLSLSPSFLSLKINLKSLHFFPNSKPWG